MVFSDLCEDFLCESAHVEVLIWRRCSANNVWELTNKLELSSCSDSAPIYSLYMANIGRCLF